MYMGKGTRTVNVKTVPSMQVLLANYNVLQ